MTCRLLVSPQYLASQAPTAPLLFGLDQQRSKLPQPLSPRPITSAVETSDIGHFIDRH